MRGKFITFLESLRDGNNKDVIDTVLIGYTAMIESYADVVDVDTIDSVTMYNRASAMNAMNNGMPVLQFLQTSSDSIKKLYSQDSDPHLDNNRTWEYQNWWDKTYRQEQKHWEQNMGLTASDLSDMSDSRSLSDMSDLFDV